MVENTLLYIVLGRSTEIHMQKKKMLGPVASLSTCFFKRTRQCAHKLVSCGEMIMLQKGWPCISLLGFGAKPKKLHLCPRKLGAQLFF